MQRAVLTDESGVVVSQMFVQDSVPAYLDELARAGLRPIGAMIASDTARVGDYYDAKAGAFGAKPEPAAPELPPDAPLSVEVTQTNVPTTAETVVVEQPS